MYKNYGDKNFFEHGMLVDNAHSDTEIQILACEPYPDEEDVYMFGDCTVDITDSWIDRNAVMNFIGMTEEKFDPIEFAIGCMSYYSWDNFGADNYFVYDWRHINKSEICKILKYKLIASDNLDICW